MWVQKPKKKCVQKRFYLQSWSCENGGCPRNIIDDSVIIFDEIIETRKSILTKTTPTNFNEKKVICKMKTFNILLAFLLITMILLIAVMVFIFA